MLKNPSKGLHFFLFITVLIIVAWYYDFGRIAFMGPQSYHQWRQADGASLALNYYHDGMDFWQPRIHNCNWSNDAHAVGEFPILYYIAAMCYPIFGEQEWILKILTFSFFALGLFAFSRLLLHLTQDFFTAFCLPLLFLASPLLVFYGFSYLPNMPALGLSFIALLFFYKYLKTKKTKWFYTFNGIFTLAALLKPTVAILWFAVGVLWTFEIVKGWILKRFITSNMQQNKEAYEYFSSNRLFPKPFYLFPAFLLGLLPVVFWQFWVDYYNQLHENAFYFLRDIFPIWTINAEKRQYTWLVLKNIHAPTMFLEWTHYIIIAIFFFNIFTFKKQTKWLFWLMILSFLGVWVYLMLWFPQFTVHNYYSTDGFIFPIITLACFVNYLKKNSEILNNIFYKIIVIGLIVWNIVYCQSVLKKIYDPKGEIISNSVFSKYKTLDLRKKMQSFGIQPTDTIISLPDISPNTSLYYYDCRGFTNWNLDVHVSDYYWVAFYAERMKCKYLIINDLQHKSLDTLRPYLPQPLSVIDSTFFIYDLNKMIQNKANDPSVQKAEKLEKEKRPLIH